MPGKVAPLEGSVTAVSLEFVYLDDKTVETDRLRPRVPMTAAGAMIGLHLTVDGKGHWNVGSAENPQAYSEGVIEGEFARIGVTAEGLDAAQVQSDLLYVRSGVTTEQDFLQKYGTGNIAIFLKGGQSIRLSDFRPAFPLGLLTVQQSTRQHVGLTLNQETGAWRLAGDRQRQSLHLPKPVQALLRAGRAHRG